MRKKLDNGYHPTRMSYALHAAAALLGLRCNVINIR